MRLGAVGLARAGALGSVALGVSGEQAQGIVDEADNIADEEEHRGEHAAQGLGGVAAIATTLAQCAMRNAQSASRAAVAHINAAMLSARTLAATSMISACWLRPETDSRCRRSFRRLNASSIRQRL